MAALSDIYEVVDRSIFKAIEKVAVDNNFTPDRAINNTSLLFNQRLDEIKLDKGFALEIFGYSSPEVRGNKKVPRIVYNSLRSMTGNLGNAPGKYYEDNGDNFLIKSSQIRTSDLIVEIYLTSNSAAQDRILHSILNAAISNRGYITFYNNPNEKFFLEQMGERKNPDIREGIIEKVYIYRVEGLYETEPEELGIASKIHRIDISENITIKGPGYVEELEPFINFYTEVEKVLWIDRSINGPYKSDGDSGENLPGDWDRIEAAAISFLADPSVDRFTNFYQGPGQVPTQPVVTTYDPGHKGTDMHDAALYYLITGDVSYGNLVKSELLTYVIREPFLDFSNRSLWGLDANNDVNPIFFTVGAFIAKCIHCFDYTKNLYTEAEITEINTYFYNAADYCYLILQNDIAGAFENQDMQNGTVIDSADNYWTAHVGTDQEYTHDGGYKNIELARKFNNRMAEIAKTMAMVGVYQDVELFREESKAFFKNWLKYGIYPESTPAEMFRNTADHRESGFNYGIVTAYLMAEIAHVFHLIGDNELYDYSTREGILSSIVDPSDSPKSLLNVIRWFCNRVESRNNPSLKLYIHNHAGDDTYSIDGIYVTADSFNRIYEKDLYFFKANQYYNNAYVESIAMRTHENTVPIAADPSDGVITFKGPYWAQPGLLFQYGPTVPVIPPEEETIPDPPTNLVATAVSSSQIDLSWENLNDGNSQITGHRIYTRIGGSGIFNLLILNTGTATTSRSITNLDPGTLHEYKVHAINAIGVSLGSAIFGATTMP